MTPTVGLLGELQSIVHCQRRFNSICRRVRESESEVKKCWRYTWMGPVTETTNQTSNCLDFQDEESGQTRPCFEPLVWTVNDDNGDNEPNLDELEAACKEKGCDPFCTPSPSQTCVKYTEWKGDTLSYVSKVMVDMELGTFYQLMF